MLNMTHEELYFRFLVVLFGIAISVGALILDTSTILRIMQAAMGIFTTIILFIWRVKK